MKLTTEEVGIIHNALLIRLAQLEFYRTEGDVEQFTSLINKFLQTANATAELLSAFYALLDWVENIPDSAGVLEGFGEVTTRAREALAKFEGYDAQTCTCGTWPTYKPGRHHRETCRMYRDASQG